MVERLGWAMLEALQRATGALRDRRGQGTVEYGFLLAIIAIGVAAALYLLRDRLAALFQNIANQL